MVQELRPPPPPTRPVAVLASDQTAGAVLTPRTVVVQHVPEAAVPDGALTDVADAVGHRLAVALPGGFPLARGVLAGPGLAEGAPPGTVVVPVRLADAGVARLLGAGDRIDLLQADGYEGAQARVLARSALVLARADDAEPGLLGSPTVQAPLLLVAVSPAAATLLSGASTWAPLSAVLLAP